MSTNTSSMSTTRRGFLGITTVAALTGAIGHQALFAPQAHAASIDGSKLPVVQYGATGPAVKLLQRLLSYNGISTSPDSSFGASTKANVITYQKKKGLAADGVAGAATWGTILGELRYGSTGAVVTVLQLTLHERGYSSLAADASFGPATQSAVKTFQSKRGLVADGVVGTLTWKALSDGGVGGGAWVTLDQLKTDYAGDGMGRYSCGPTSVAMVLLAKGKTPSGYLAGNYALAVDRLRTLTGTTTAGTGATGMQKGFTQYGLTDTVTANTASALTAARSGKPVVLNGYTGALPWLGGTTGHYIVVSGYNASTGLYTVRDPWRGKTVTATGTVLSNFGNSVGDPRGGTWRRHHIIG